jgi:hypothetical protein
VVDLLREYFLQTGLSVFEIYSWVWVFCFWGEHAHELCVRVGHLRFSVRGAPKWDDCLDCESTASQHPREHTPVGCSSYSQNVRGVHFEYIVKYVERICGVCFTICCKYAFQACWSVSLDYYTFTRLLYTFSQPLYLLTQLLYMQSTNIFSLDYCSITQLQYFHLTTIISLDY